MAVGTTIFALSSGPGKAGVAVIRVSGPVARSVMAAMAAPEVADRRVAFRRIVHPQTGALLDRAVVVFFAGPKSETGEDVVEFQGHGGRAVVRAILDALATIPGCRMAEPGEFARRAFHNGKLNLVEVESLADLVDAETDAQRRLALASGGQLTALYDEWRTRLIEVAALTEAAIDFSDEGDVSAASFEAARRAAAPLADDVARHLDDGHRGEILRDGFRVALLGAPNAGKSSLLNALARRDAAIVSEDAGTTRDVIEVRLDLDGYPVIVSDTAGIREADGRIEQEGIRRSLSAARDANLTLWLSELGLDSPPKEISRETLLAVRTKTDLDLPNQAVAPGSDLAISTKSGAGLGELVSAITRRAADALSQSADMPAVARARHRALLEQARASLGDFLTGSADELELRAEDVRRAAHALGRITGRVDVEDVLDQIFSRFCIGK
ncbi:MAG TPA: tRNA uridine-5-carboxymethylaminomethyl(34) synthesis GTPase MnmE [Hyphomicrobium sp.]|nr:tRNA uridine-5-carboxymethylaminomethyl(34) synthesis GTPase MnmE [Hyphomicrobium sp.]